MIWGNFFLTVHLTQSVPMLISTKRFVARVAHKTKLERGTTTRVWVDLELQGEKYQPGENDLLVADLTSGWMRRSLLGQGLKKEVDHTGERRWCIFVYQPAEGNVEYLPTSTVIAKVTSQCLEVNWPPLPAPRRSGGTTQPSKKHRNKKKNHWCSTKWCSWTNDVVCQSRFSFYFLNHLLFFCCTKCLKSLRWCKDQKKAGV